MANKQAVADHLLSTERLAELADRCEKAVGPDRELDREIALAAGWEYQGNLQFGWYTPHWWRDGRSPREVVGLWVPEGQLPAFTDSLDAAMTLVPEGCGHAIWSVIGKKPCAAIQFPDSEQTPHSGLTVDGWTDWHGASTPALALCAAALRARAAMKVEA